MCKGCGGGGDRRVTEGRQRIREAQERFGTTRVFEHLRCSLEVAEESVRYLNRSDRAAAFGLPADVVETARREAERRNAVAQHHARAGLEALQARRRESDWRGLAKEVQKGLAREGGAEFVAYMQDNTHTFLAEADIDPETAVWAGGITDDMFGRLHQDPLNGWADFVDSWLSRAVEELQSPEMGRQEASPRSVLVAICVATAVAGLAAGLVACFIWGFCAWHMAVMAAYMFHMLMCLALDAALAAAGG